MHVSTLTVMCVNNKEATWYFQSQVRNLFFWRKISIISSDLDNFNVIKKVRFNLYPSQGQSKTLIYSLIITLFVSKWASVWCLLNTFEVRKITEHDPLMNLTSTRRSDRLQSFVPSIPRILVIRGSFC